MTQTFAHYVTILRKEFADYCTRILAAEGMLPGQLYFVLYVGKHPNCSPKELATALNMDAAHTTRTLTKLAQEGFLLQEKSKTDGRAHTLILTEKGLHAFQLSHELFAQWDEMILQPLSKSEKDTLLNLLGKVIDSKDNLPCDRKNTAHSD